MIFFKSKNGIKDNKAENPTVNKNLQGIIRTIEEFSDEQREIIEKFKSAMEVFTGERSLESCLQALNLSMQLANIREKLSEAHREYGHLLENELKKLIEQEKRKL